MNDVQICSRCGGPTRGQDIVTGVHRTRQIKNQEPQHRYDRDCLAYTLRTISELEPAAAFGNQCYQDRCEGALVEAAVLKRVEAQLRTAEQERDQMKGEIDAIRIAEHKRFEAEHSRPSVEQWEEAAKNVNGEVGE